MTPRKSFTTLKSALLSTTTRLTYALTTSFVTKQKGVNNSAKATRIQLDNADPTDGCHGESTNSKDEVEGTPELQPSDLIGRTFLMDVQPAGQKFRATIVEASTESCQATRARENSGYMRLLDMKATNSQRPIVLWISVERPYGVGEWGVDHRTPCGHCS